MRFKVISVKGNSVRIQSGIASFDVRVIDICGKLQMQLPPNIYIYDKRDFNTLAGAVLGEYNHSLKENHSEERNEGNR